MKTVFYFLHLDKKTLPSGRLRTQNSITSTSGSMLLRRSDHGFSLVQLLPEAPGLLSHAVPVHHQLAESNLHGVSVIGLRLGRQPSRSDPSRRIRVPRCFSVTFQSQGTSSSFEESPERTSGAHLLSEDRKLLGQLGVGLCHACRVLQSFSQLRLQSRHTRCQLTQNSL